MTHIHDSNCNPPSGEHHGEHHAEHNAEHHTMHKKDGWQEKVSRLNTKHLWQGITAALVAAILLNSFFEISLRPLFLWSGGASAAPLERADSGGKDYAAQVLSSRGVTLPVSWGDLGKKLTDSGVIDMQAMEALYAGRGGIVAAERELLTGTKNKKITMTADNSGFLLNLFWALGLANKNPVLTDGPMSDQQYGGAGGFASTGGWTLAKGDPMEHYGAHALIPLTPAQQALVENVAKNIYRPCCGNSTYFPDCNHGMAMLGLLELLAAHDVSEQDMYGYALTVNSFWFPDTYLTLAKYFDEKEGISWKQVEPKTVLGYDYSSSAGFRDVQSQVAPVQSGGGGSCGV